MNQTAFVIVLVLALLTSLALSLQVVSPVLANPEGSIPSLTMSMEHVNYTITQINGTLWAKIDGDYPIYIQNQSGTSFNGDLPMVYPMPPGTTNIHVYLGNREFEWSNYTQTYPDELHHTAIGDWWMIYSVLPNVSGFFELKIHYEHPLQTVNGSYLFLYDLNISPYLSGENENSTAYFNVEMDSNAIDINVFTAPPDSVASEWKPIDYTTTNQGPTKIVNIQMFSENPDVSGKSLAGDLVVEFSDSSQTTTLSSWIIPVLVDVFLVAVLLYVKRKLVLSALRLKKTAS